MANLPMDLTLLSEQELIALNHKIVERLRFLRDSKAHHQMLDLRVGDRVSFSGPEPGEKIIGTILRLNRKSVSLVCSDGMHWKVTPSLLSRLETKDVDIEMTPIKNKPQAANPFQDALRLVPRPSSTSNVPRNAPCPCGSSKKFKRCCLPAVASGYR